MTDRRLGGTGNSVAPSPPCLNMSSQAGPVVRAMGGAGHSVLPALWCRGGIEMEAAETSAVAVSIARCPAVQVTRSRGHGETQLRLADVNPASSQNVKVVLEHT